MSVTVKVGPDDPTLLYGTRDSVLLVLPTMSESYDCENWDAWELSSIVRSTNITLRQLGTVFHGDTVPCPKEKSCIVYTDLQITILLKKILSSNYS